MSAPSDDPPGVLAQLDPSPSALLDVLGLRVDDALLVEMARADYGQEADAHLRALRAIRDQGVVPALLEWVPEEVLCLVRWSKPEELRSHLKRAFACGALLRAGAESANRSCNFTAGENVTLAPLLASVLALGGDLPEAALRFLAWRLRGEPLDAADRPFFALGALLLAAVVEPPILDAGRLSALAELVIEEEAGARVAAGEGPFDGGGGWLLWRTHYVQSHELWLSLARQLSSALQARPFGDVPEALRLIGELLL
jgi:hypothetical protein